MAFPTAANRSLTKQSIYWRVLDIVSCLIILDLAADKIGEHHERGGKEREAGHLWEERQLTGKWILLLKFRIL